MSEMRYKVYKRGQVLFVDFGNRPPGVEGGLRPCVVVSCNKSNHVGAQQITVCPLSSKLKQIPVHVQIKPDDVKGYSLKTVSDFLPEDIQTIPKSAVRGELGYISERTPVMQKINRVLRMQLGLTRDEDADYGKEKV